MRIMAFLCFIKMNSIWARMKETTKEEIVHCL